MKESVEVIRAREAIEALKLAREVLMVGASSLVRAGDDDGLFYSNELHAVCQELNEHMRQIKANTVDDFSQEMRTGARVSHLRLTLSR